MTLKHSSDDFKKLIDTMMPDTDVFRNKEVQSSNMYKWHFALAKCLVEINDVVYLGWLNYFIDTASDDTIRLLASEMLIPDDIFTNNIDIDSLRLAIKAKRKIRHGVVTEQDYRDVAKIFGIENLIFTYGDDGAYLDDDGWIFEVGPSGEDFGLPFFDEDDESHAFITIYLPADLIISGIKTDNAIRFETLVQRLKSSYARVSFVYSL